MRASGSTVIWWPLPSVQPIERDLAEINAAIELVSRGAATTVSITGLGHAESVAGIGAAMAQQAGVAFKLDRDGSSGGGTVRVGPQL